MERTRLGTVAVVLGVVLLVGNLAASAALAPSIDTRGDDDVETLVGIQGGGPGWHQYGSVAMYGGTEPTWRERTADSYFDVTYLDNGSVMAGFMDGGYEDCGRYEAPCTHTGFRIIDPEPQPEVVYEYSFPVRTEGNSEVHDVEMLGDGEFLLTDMEHERILVVEDGAVVWEWRASELYEKPQDVTRRDWLHINDVDVVGEGRYLVSVRNANQLVVVDREEGAVEVINEDPGGSDESCLRRDQLVDRDGDGDVRCGDPDVLDHQHNPQWLGDGAVLVADSDNHRAVELHRTGDGDWAVAWTLRAVGGLQLDWPRDADRLPNGNTLVTDTLNRRIVEIDRNGTVVWSVRTDRIPYEAERVPVNEPVGGATYGEVNEGDPVTAREDVPVLSFLVSVLRGAAPWLPYWVGELQVGLSGLGLLFVFGGWRLRRDGDGLLGRLRRSDRFPGDGPGDE